MSNILHQISLIAENEGITITALEKEIGASKGVLSRAIAKGTDIQAKWIRLIVENYPHYNPEWVISNVGPMYRLEHSPPTSTPPPAQKKPEQPISAKVNDEALSYIIHRYESLVAENAILKYKLEQVDTNRKNK